MVAGEREMEISASGWSAERGEGLERGGGEARWGRRGGGWVMGGSREETDERLSRLRALTSCAALLSRLLQLGTNARLCLFVCWASLQASSTSTSTPNRRCCYARGTKEREHLCRVVHC